MANTTIDISRQSSDRSSERGTENPWSVFSELMTAVTDAGIRYVVLGDTSQFPNIDGGDIDIAISDGDFPALERVLLNFKGVNDVQLVQAIEHEQTSRFYILAWGRPSARPLYIQLDTCSHYFRSGKMLMTAEELIANRQLLDFSGTQIFVPSQGSQFVYYIIKKIKKGILSSEHASYLTSTWGSMTSEQKHWATQHFNDTSVDDLESVVSDGFSDADTTRLEQRFLPAAKTTFRHKLKEWARLARRYLNPTGLFVVMMGPDGSGKTTINNLAREYVDTAFWGLLYMHFRPFFGVNGDDSDIVEDPHAEPPRSWFASTLKLCYYVFDYIIGYWAIPNT